jgi:hypothetical protein
MTKCPAKACRFPCLVEVGWTLQNFHDNGVVRCVSIETAKHTEGSSSKKITLLWLTLDEANSFINGTDFGRIDANKATDAVSIDNGTARRN